MKETIIERLQCFMESLGINNNQMTVNAGLSVGLIGKSIKTNKGIHSDSIEKILYAYPILNPLWLLTGDGDMLRTSLKNDHSNTLNEQKSITESITRSITEDEILRKNGNLNGNPNTSNDEKNARVDAHLSEKYTSPILKEDIETIKGQPVIYSHKPSIKAVPYYDLPVSAGPLGLIDVGDGRDAAGYVDLPAFYGCEEILPVLGISMEPLIYSGDFIGVKSITNLSTRWDFLQTGKIYLIVTREERMIKYLNEASDSENIICSSPNYTSFKVHKRDILEIHRVVAVARGL